MFGSKPVRGEGIAPRFLETALASSYPPGTVLRGPAVCTGCGQTVTLTTPVGNGTPRCPCGNGVLTFRPWVTAGFDNPALNGPKEPA